MEIDVMCSDAQTRVLHSINRSEGQHVRAMREARQSAIPTTADIYAMGMESPTAYRFSEWLCKEAGVSYPPKQMGVLCQSQL